MTAAPNESRPLVALVAAGGTITNSLGGRLGIERVLADIGASYPEHDPNRIARLEVRREVVQGGVDLSWAGWLEIAHAVSESVADPEVTGVVVTHGTFTIEETAYLLHLLVRTEKPVVLACSQRKHGEIGNDGDRNLVDAIRVACDPAATNRGAMLVANEEIHCGRDVTKTNQRPGGFSSGGTGILGSVETDRVTFYRTPVRRHTWQSEFSIARAPASPPRVDVASCHVDADDVAIRAFVDAGARGLVVAGFSYSGQPTYVQLAALRRAVEQGVAVVIVSRGGDGRVPMPTAPFVGGDNLSPQKARILLMLGLANGIEDLGRLFSEY